MKKDTKIILIAILVAVIFLMRFHFWPGGFNFGFLTACSIGTGTWLIVEIARLSRE